MNKKQRSILQQKAKKTYKRNQYIRWLYKKGGEGNMAEIGRAYGISRQAVRKIINETK